ncbi:MAG: amidohydrolase family protein [Rhodospirillales bacterium]|nr:amidohydrolase family protein [Rhodospirillales bacterium]
MAGPKKKITAIKGGQLIDGNGGAVVKNPVILIQDDRIKEIGPASKVKIPQGAEVIDVKGHTLMPGMMDLHIHLCMFNNLTFKNYRVAQWEVTPELQQLYALFHGQLCLEMGFTTLRDLGFITSRGLVTDEMCAVRDAINARIFEGPRLVIGAFTVATGSHLDLINPRAVQRTGFVTADGPDELRKLARTNLLKGCDVIKTCASGGGGTDKEEPDIRNHTPEELFAIADEAHMNHKRCAIHCFTPEAQRVAMKAGADTLEHMVFHEDETIAEIAEKQIPVTPTLAHRTDHAIDIRREMGTAEFILKKMKAIQPYCFETLQKMYAAGVKIAMGTDMGYEPDMGSNAYELELYVGLGMKPMDAIMTATKNAAEALGMQKDIGTLEKGKLADVVVVDGDPLRNIKILQKREKIAMVFKDGRVMVDRRPGKDVRVIQADYRSWDIIDK